MDKCIKKKCKKESLDGYNYCLEHWEEKYGNIIYSSPSYNSKNRRSSSKNVYSRNIIIKRRQLKALQSSSKTQLNNISSTFLKLNDANKDMAIASKIVLKFKSNKFR